MTISIFSAAKKICELGDWNVSNLQLQKVLYLAHMVFMGKNNGEPLVSSKFEAWDYGPVSPDLYHAVEKYGNKPIRTGFYNAKNIDGTKEEKELTDAASYLLKQSPSRLVDFTHRKGGAWEKYYTPGVRGIAIPNEDVLAEYKELFNVR